MKTTLMTAAFAVLATGAIAEPVQYDLDPSHSQIVFSYNHLGYSTNYGMFSGFEGEVMFDEEDPAASSVTVSMPVRSMMTGWEARFEHLMGDDFFGASDEDMVTFTSTSIEVTGDNTADITGDLTIGDTTQEVVLDATLNQASQHPMAGKAWLGVSATTTILRSDFGVGAFAPNVSDEVEVDINIEAGVAE